MSDDICVGGDVTGGKKKCGAILRFNGTLKGNTRFLLLVNLLCFSSRSFFSPGPGKSKTKGEGGGGSAAVLGPVTSLIEQIWSSSSLESSSMLSHKALFCQQSERREMGERKKKENVIQGEKIA